MKRRSSWPRLMWLKGEGRSVLLSLPLFYKAAVSRGALCAPNTRKNTVKEGHEAPCL